MKVIIIGDFCYPNYMGGSSKHVYDLITNFPKFGVQTCLITRKKASASNYSAQEIGAEEVYNDIKNLGKVKEIASYNIFNPFVYWKEISNADYIILEHPIMGVPGGIVGKLFRKKIVYHYHGPIHLEYELKSHKRGLQFRLLWLLQKLTVIIADKVITHSNYMRDISIKEHSVPMKKTFHLPPYIEANRPDEELPFFKTQDKINLLIPRRLTARTGVSEFITTFLKLEDNIRNKYHIYISGKGELQNKIEDLVKRDSDNLSYVGFLSYNELWSLYNQIDSVVVPTLDLEGFGYVILEALSSGAAAIVSKTCGGGYEFVNQYLGPDYVFDVFSKQSVLKALDTIEINRNNRMAYKELAEKFNITNMINHYIHKILI